MNLAVRVWVCLAAGFVACTPSAPPAAPVVDSGDGGSSYCAADCARRAAIGCLEPAFAARCVSTCERAIEAGLFESCAACDRYVGGDGLAHTRCKP